MGTAVAAGLAASLLPLWRFASNGTATAGIVLFAAGIALMFWAALWFWRKRTAIEPRERPKALIVEGPFRINRNPIYTGMALAVFGVALWFGALSGLLVALAFPPIVTHRFILGEEAALRDAFGEEARRYFERTRRW